MINWKVRMKNKAFWLALIPALLLLAQAVAGICGCTLDLSAAQEKLLLVVNAVFGVLTVLGIVNDPTTAGLGDSENALGYTVPRA